MGYVIGILGGVCLSIDSILIRLMQLDSPWVITILRGMLMWGTLCLAYALLPRYRHIIGQPWLTKQNVLPAALFGCSSITFVLAIHTGNIATVLVIIAATPFVSALICWLGFRENLSLSTLLATGAGVVGVMITLYGGFEFQAPWANVYAILTSVLMASAFIAAAKQRASSIGLPAIGGLLSAIALVCLQPSILSHIPSINPTQWGWIIAEGMVAMPLAMGLLALSTRYLSPTLTSLFLLLEAALAPIWAWLILGEITTFYTLIGASIIIIAIVSKVGVEQSCVTVRNKPLLGK